MPRIYVVSTREIGSDQDPLPIAAGNSRDGTLRLALQVTFRDYQEDDADKPLHDAANANCCKQLMANENLEAAEGECDGWSYYWRIDEVEFEA